MIGVVDSWEELCPKTKGKKAKAAKKEKKEQKPVIHQASAQRTRKKVQAGPVPLVAAPEPEVEPETDDNWAWAWAWAPPPSAELELDFFAVPKDRAELGANKLCFLVSTCSRPEAMETPSGTSRCGVRSVECFSLAAHVPMRTSRPAPALPLTSPFLYTRWDHHPTSKSASKFQSKFQRSKQPTGLHLGKSLESVYVFCSLSGLWFGPLCRE